MIVFTERGIKIKHAGVQKEQNERTRVGVIYTFTRRIKGTYLIGSDQLSIFQRLCFLEQF